MGRRSIELVKVLVDQIHQGGYQHRVLEDSIYAETQKRIAAEKDRDHWKQARDTAIEGCELLLKSNQTLQAEIETLRTQLANAQQELSEQSMVINVETQQDAAAWQQQVDSANAEAAYLRARLDEERSVIAGLRKELADAQRAVSDAFAEVNSVRQQLDAANAAVTLQRSGIERLHKFVGTVRLAMWPEDIKSALTELDAGAEPTPVAEPLDAEGGA
jgi:chromosome segregation ATPase